VFAVAPAIGLGIATLALSTRAEGAACLANPTSRRLLLCPELVIVPATVLLGVVLLGENAAMYAPEEPNPEREFTASEGWDRVDAVVADTLPALESVEGFTNLGQPYDADWGGSCEDGAALGEPWVEYRRTYTFAPGDAIISDELWGD
jgi:hypothetical protein